MTLEAMLDELCDLGWRVELHMGSTRDDWICYLCRVRFDGRIVQSIEGEGESATEAVERALEMARAMP